MAPRWIAVPVLVLVCLGIVMPVSAQPDRAKTAAEGGELARLERPSGPFRIGRAGYHWIDTARPDRFASGNQTHRELMVYVWYPASAGAGGGEAPYFPWAKEMDADAALGRRMRGEFGIHWPAIVSGAIRSHASEAAPVVPKPKRLPVVLFSHGNGSTGFNYASLLEDLASHGYAVAAIEHTHTAAAVRFPDGRMAPFQNENAPAGLSRAERLRWMMNGATAAIAEGAADIRFVKERLAELNAGDARAFPLARRLDMRHIAAMGHSAGGAFAARACQLDSSLAACVDLDGGMPPVAVLPVFPDAAAMKQPLLLLEPQAAESRMAGTKDEIQAYLRKKEQQLQGSAPGSYHVILKAPGIAHPSFSDTPLFFAGRDGFPPIAAVRHNHRLIQAFIRAFLDKNFKGRKAALLDGRSGAHPEATVRRYGSN